MKIFAQRKSAGRSCSPVPFLSVFVCRSSCWDFLKHCLEICKLRYKQNCYFSNAKIRVNKMRCSYSPVLLLRSVCFTRQELLSILRHTAQVNWQRLLVLTKLAPIYVTGLYLNQQVRYAQYFQIVFCFQLNRIIMPDLLKMPSCNILSSWAKIPRFYKVIFRMIIQ